MSLNEKSCATKNFNSHIFSTQNFDVLKKRYTNFYYNKNYFILILLLCTCSPALIIVARFLLAHKINMNRIKYKPCIDTAIFTRDSSEGIREYVMMEGEKFGGSNDQNLRFERHCSYSEPKEPLALKNRLQEWQLCQKICQWPVDQVRYNVDKDKSQRIIIIIRMILIRVGGIACIVIVIAIVIIIAVVIIANAHVEQGCPHDDDGMGQIHCVGSPREKSCDSRLHVAPSLKDNQHQQRHIQTEHARNNIERPPRFYWQYYTRIYRRHGHVLGDHHKRQHQGMNVELFHQRLRFEPPLRVRLEA